MTYRTIRTCQDRAPERRAATGCRRSRRAAGRTRSAEADQDQRGDRDEDERGCTAARRRRPPTRASGARAGRPSTSATDLELPDVRQPEDDQAHAQGHDQRVDPEDADADAGDQAGQGGRRRARPRSRPASRRRLTSDATTKPAIEATAPTERSMPPVSIVSVWQPARIASGTAARRMTPTHSGPTMPGRTRSLTTTRTASRPSSGIDRPVAEQRAPARGREPRARGSEAPARPLMLRRDAGSGRGCRS